MQAEQQALVQQPNAILLTKILGKYITAEPIEPLIPLEKLQSLMYGFILFINQEPTPKRMHDLIGSIKKMIDDSPNEIIASIKVANAFLRLLRLGMSQGNEGPPIYPEEITEENIGDFYQWFRGHYSRTLIISGIPYQQETSGRQPSVTNVESIWRHDMHAGFNSELEQRQREELQIDACMAAAAAYEVDRIRHIHTASAFRNTASNQEGYDRMISLSAADEEERKARESLQKVEEQRRIAEEIRKTLEGGWTLGFTQFPRKGGYKRKYSKKSKKKHLKKKNKTRNKKQKQKDQKIIKKY